MEEKSTRKPAFTVIDGGKDRKGENPGGPDFGAGIKAEEAKHPLKPLTPEEVDDMHRGPDAEASAGSSTAVDD